MLPAIIGAGALAVTAAASVANWYQQKKQQEYERGLQHRVFEREDDAVSRRMWDLRQAGLSPTLAAGSAAGTGGIVSSQAPQWETNQTDKVSQVYALAKMQQDISQGQQAIETQKIQNQKTTAEIGMMPTIQKNMEAQTINLGANAWKTSVDAQAKNIDLKIQKETGGTSTPDTVSNFIRNATGAISKQLGTHPNQLNNAKGDVLKKTQGKTKTPQKNDNQYPDYIKKRGGL
nr:MAG: DNA pilot protein [Microvirus sp.]